MLISLGKQLNMIKFTRRQNASNWFFCFEFAFPLFILTGCVILPLPKNLASRMNAGTKDDTIFLFGKKKRKRLIRLALFCLRKLLAGQNKLFQHIPVNSRVNVVFA